MQKKALRISLLLSFLFIFGYQANAQALPDPTVNNCDHCPTFGLQINPTYDGECGYAFSYSGLIGCTVLSADWEFHLPLLFTGTASGDNVYYEFDYPGTYTVTLTLTLSDGSQVCATQVTTTVDVDPNTCQPELTCTGGGYLLDNIALQIYVGPDCQVLAGLSANSWVNTPFYTYDMTWNWGDGSLFHGVYGGTVYQYQRSGIYTICVTIHITDGVDSCQRKFCRQVELDCDPMKRAFESFSPEVEVFPNPVQAGSRITLRGELDPSIRELHLVDAQGRLVAEWNAIDTSLPRQVLPIPSGLAPGIYFLRSNSPAMPMQKLILR